MDLDEERDFADQGPLTDMEMEEDAEILALLLKVLQTCIPGYRTASARHSRATACGSSSQDGSGGCSGWRPSPTGCRCKHILQDHVRQHNTNAAELKNLIQRVLHHPDFNSDEVDHDMYERLMRAVEEGDIEVIDMCHVEGSLRKVMDIRTTLLSKVSKVLMELHSDERMAGHQHLGFKLRTDANGNRIFGGDANGSLTFELAQLRVDSASNPLLPCIYICPVADVLGQAPLIQCFIGCNSHPTIPYRFKDGRRIGHTSADTQREAAGLRQRQQALRGEVGM
jgi:hypothetical protein